MSISGHKYDACEKLSCKRAPSVDKDKMDKTTDKPPKCKAALKKEKEKNQQPTQSDEVTKIWDTEAEADTNKMDTDKELLYSYDDSLLDPFPPSQPKKFDTKNPADISKKPHNK